MQNTISYEEMIAYCNSRGLDSKSINDIILRTVNDMMDIGTFTGICHNIFEAMEYDKNVEFVFSDIEAFVQSYRESNEHIS